MYYRCGWLCWAGGIMEQVEIKVINQGDKNKNTFLRVWNYILKIN